MESRRDEFLVEMYRQMFNDINRHLSLIWQAVGVLVGALALFALSEKGIVSIDVSTAMILILCGWLVAHIYDSSYWYNRNLVIISNIERQFLEPGDAKLIHYYFASHRPGNVMMKQLNIQLYFGLAFAALILMVHFFDRVVPGLHSPWSSIDPPRAAPYLVSLACAIYLYWFKGNRDASYADFLTNSPGIAISAPQIVPGVGHGRGKSFWKWLIGSKDQF